MNRENLFYQLNTKIDSLKDLLYELCEEYKERKNERKDNRNNDGYNSKLRKKYYNYDDYEYYRDNDYYDRYYR